MPNHFHAIVGIIDPNAGTNPPPHSHDDGNVGVDSRVNPERDGSPVQGRHAGPPQQDLPQSGLDYEPRPASIPEIVQWFKTMTTNEYTRGVKEGQFPPLDRRLWQRNYYEHIIRNERSLQRIRDYIINNPAQWKQDRKHPNNLDP